MIWSIMKSFETNSFLNIYKSLVIKTKYKYTIQCQIQTHTMLLSQKPPHNLIQHFQFFKVHLQLHELYKSKTSLTTFGTYFLHAQIVFTTMNLLEMTHFPVLPTTCHQTLDSLSKTFLLIYTENNSSLIYSHKPSITNQSRMILLCCQIEQTS